MIKVTVLNKTNLARIAARLPAFYLGIGEAIKNKIQPYPGPVRRPIRWASERQRRYVLARVRPLPYRRQTHPLSQRLATSWRVRAERRGAVVVSRARYARHVVGDRQQPMHRATGWPRADRVIRDVKPQIVRLAKRILR